MCVCVCGEYDGSCCESDDDGFKLHLHTHYRKNIIIIVEFRSRIDSDDDCTRRVDRDL